MTESRLIVFTGDKGGVGKSTLAVLMTEWLLSNGKQVQLVDEDLQRRVVFVPNRLTNTKEQRDGLEELRKISRRRDGDGWRPASPTARRYTLRCSTEEKRISSPWRWMRR